MQAADLVYGRRWTDLNRRRGARGPLARGPRPTAITTATRAHRGDLRRAGAPEAPRSRTPTNGAEPRKQSLKIGVTGPRALTPLLRCPVPADGTGHSRPRRLRRPANQPRGRPVRASPFTRAGGRRGTPRSHFVGWGRGPPIPPAQKPARGLPGGLVGAGYWGSSGRTLAAWAPLGPDVTSNSTTCPSSSER